MRTFVEPFIRRPRSTLGLLVLVVLAGLTVAPWNLTGSLLPQAPLPVDAVPDLADNQQIIEVRWPGRAPEELDRLVCRPLGDQLSGLPGVRTVRSSAAQGWGIVTVVLEPGVASTTARALLVERLASLPPDRLPPDATVVLGPDATGLGQVAWMVLELLDAQGLVVSPPDPGRARAWLEAVVLPRLERVPGVAEAAPVGGAGLEFQVDLDPLALQHWGVSVEDVIDGLRRSGRASGAHRIGTPGREAMIRIPGEIGSLADLKSIPVGRDGDRTIRLEEVAHLLEGPGPVEGWLDLDGAPALGVVVASLQGTAPREVVEAVRAALPEAAALIPPVTLPDGSSASWRLRIVHDRGALVDRTLRDLGDALFLQVLLTSLAAIALLGSARTGLVASSLLPVSMLLALVSMKLMGIPAHLVSLAGIAIAIGSITDMGVVLLDDILHRRREAPGESMTDTVLASASRTGPALLTAMATTVTGFLPVFALGGPEAQLFHPLAWTKTLTMAGSLIAALVFLPVIARALLQRQFPGGFPNFGGQTVRLLRLALLTACGVGLALLWRPAGASSPVLAQIGATMLLVGIPLVGFSAFQKLYPRLLSILLQHPWPFLLISAVVATVPLTLAAGLGRAWMPRLEEGDYLLMPVAPPAVSTQAMKDLLSQLDRQVAAVPGVREVLGKVGRAASPLDPAPIQMVEALVVLDDTVSDPAAIWPSIEKASRVPGLTGSARLQPIEARQAMLRTGMRGTWGYRVRGHDLDSLEVSASRLAAWLRRHPAIREGTVWTEPLRGRPSLEIIPHREALGRAGLPVADFAMQLEATLGGMPVAQAREGALNIPVRVRWAREIRDDPRRLSDLPISGMGGAWYLLGDLAEIRHRGGPDMVRSEDGVPITWVTFDVLDGSDPAQTAEALIDSMQAADSRLRPAAGTAWSLAGAWEDQLRAEARLRLIVPLTLLLVAFLLRAGLGSWSLAAMVGTGVVFALGGGFLALHVWNLFRPDDPVALSVATWVGFIALFGVATDDGVVMATFLKSGRAATPPRNEADIERIVLNAGRRRIGACLVTTATTILSLMPVIVLGGRGAELLRPLALPLAGGMTLQLWTLFLVPVLWSLRERRRLQKLVEGERP